MLETQYQSIHLSELHETRQSVGFRANTISKCFGQVERPTCDWLSCMAGWVGSCRFVSKALTNLGE